MKRHDKRLLKRALRNPAFVTLQPGDSLTIAFPADCGMTAEMAERIKSMLGDLMPQASFAVGVGFRESIVYRGQRSTPLGAEA